MLKLFGAGLTMFSCFAAGCLICAEMKKRIHILEELRRMTVMLSAEIGYANTMLDEAFGSIAKRVSPPLSDFLVHVQEKMQKGEEANLGVIFEKQLEKCGVEYFDFYLFHNVCEMNIDAYLDEAHGIFAYLIEMFGLIPWVISMMVAALLWRWLFNGDLGLFNMILKILGHNPIYVVENKNSAIIALIFVLTWRLVGYAMIMILAGLKSLDPTLIEAAKVDGASPWQMLWHIKLPLIKTQLLLSIIVLTVSNFTNNTVPKVLTSGGPNDATNVITLFQYNLGFRYYQFGTSAALSILIMLITSLIIVLYIKVSNYKI
mgnify:CR=1 FL=1